MKFFNSAMPSFLVGNTRGSAYRERGISDQVVAPPLLSQLFPASIRARSARADASPLLRWGRWEINGEEGYKKAAWLGLVLARWPWLHARPRPKNYAKANP
uniref:Uncharacterized protein n=1 Tax=Morchella brunnea TaxID=1174671 RepID=A0A8K1I827_9PEZI|nr:hypothetical protein LK370_mgp009 [Morchella brunnea]UBU98470.1 hypothetical protein [Morchella brunnea]